MSCDNCQVEFHDYYSENTYTWCTNCGNYGIAAATKRALAAENRDPQHTILAFDIGCNGNGADKINGYRIHGLHGRVLALAAGISIARPDLTLVASAGDGATLSEGINHLVHAVRCNYKMVFILHNNENYGLTTGQASTTTRTGVAMNSTPDGVFTPPLNVANFVLSLNPTFFARGFSGEINQLTDILRTALNHPGFAMVEVLQDCPTYNKATPHEWYLEHIYDVATHGDYNPQDLEAARKLSLDLQDKIATGVLYQNTDRPDYYASLSSRHGKETNLAEEVTPQSINHLLTQYR